MTNKVKATLAGIAASLIGVVLWLVLALGLGIIAGIAGMLMGTLFLWVYKKVNPEDKSWYPVIFASLLIVIEIIIAEFLTILILTNRYGLNFADMVSKISTEITMDIVIGFALSFGFFIAYVFSMRRKAKPTRNRFSTAVTDQSNNDNISNNTDRDNGDDNSTNSENQF